MNKVREFLERFGSFAEQHASAREVQGSGSPRELHFELTYRCNTSCVMCNLRYLKPRGRELSCEEIGRIVDGSPLLKDIGFIVLSGGEPWLKEDLHDIIRLLRKKYPATGLLILSNLNDAALALRHLNQIESEVRLEKISIGSSLDGIGGAHDAVRGKVGSYAGLEKTLAAIRERYPALYVSLNFTLTPENADQMLPVFRWGREHRYHVSFQVMVQKRETKEFVWRKEQIEIVDRQIDAMIESMMEELGEKNIEAALLANEGFLSQLLALHYIGTYVRSPRRYFPACPCGQAYAMIDPYGHLYFCPVHKAMTAGNAAKDGFSAAWHSEAAAQTRAFFNRRECHCWLTCTNGPMLGAAIKDAKSRFLEKHYSR